MVDNVAEGAIGEKTTEETIELYEMLGAIPNRRVQGIEGVESTRCR